MGVSVGETCYENLSAALPALAQRVVSSTEQINGSSYFLVVVPAGDQVQLLYLYRSLTPGVPDIRKLVSPVAPFCDYLDYSDSVLLGWAVVLLWATAWTFRALAKVAHG